MTPLLVPWIGSETCVSPAGRRWTPDEEGGTEQQPWPCAGHGWQGGGPEQPAPGAGGPVLHRRGGHREDRFVEAAKMWANWSGDGPLWRGI